MADSYKFDRVQVSESLDALGQVVGSILVRGPDGWIALEPGPDGYVLTTHGVGNLPTWEPPL